MRYQQTKKAHTIRTGLVVCWLPTVDEFRNFLMSEEADIVGDQIRDFNVLGEQ